MAPVQGSLEPGTLADWILADGLPVRLQVQLHNAARATRYGIGVAVRGSHQSREWVWCDVPGQGSATVQVAFAPALRGLQGAPLLKLETRYPLGTFRSWALWRPAAQVLVYPAPEVPPQPLPPGEPRAGGTGNAPSQGIGEFDGVRAYRRGDPLKLVVWKKAAKSLATGTDDLVSRDAQQAQRHELWLDLAHAALPNHEARVSRLTAWVLQADRLGLDYGLRLPGTDGLRCAAQVMERHPGLGVGLMSGADDPTLGRRAQDAGLVAYLPKTLEIPALLAQLRQLAEELRHPVANQIFLSVDLNNASVPPDPYEPPILTHESGGANG